MCSSDLGGMSMRSVAGQGTTMILRLPFTVAIVRALIARVADETYAIPLAHVSETIELEPDAIGCANGTEAMLGRGEPLPLIRLRALVGLPPRAASGPIDLEHVVVIHLGDRRQGLVIDELTGQEEIVVRPYDAAHVASSFFGGATVLSDGTPSLVVDAGRLADTLAA